MRRRSDWHSQGDTVSKADASLNCKDHLPMLLALDVGNTNVTIGAFDGERLAGRWRLRTIKEQTADEWGILIRNLFTLSSLNLAAVDGVIISSVVPAVDQPLETMAERYFRKQLLFVTNTLDLGLRVRYDHPRE